MLGDIAGGIAGMKQGGEVAQSRRRLQGLHLLFFVTSGPAWEGGGRGAEGTIEAYCLQPRLKAA